MTDEQLHHHVADGDPQSTEPARQDQQYQQHSGATGQQLPFGRGDEPSDAAQVDGAQDPTAQRPETADDGRGEHIETLAGAVARDAERLAEMREQRPRDPRQHSGDHERGQLGAHHRDGIALRGTLVLADSDDHTADPRPADAARRQVAQGQHEQGVHVVAIRRVEVDLAEQRRTLESRIALREPAEESIAEQPLLGRQTERKGRHREVQAAQPQRGDADRERNDSTGNFCDNFSTRF